MAIFTARGEQAKENINRQNVDLSKVRINLKSGQSRKVRILGLNDYVEYKAHSSFNHKIYTQPCIEVLGKECPLCTASKSGIEEFEALRPKKRYVFAFGDMETGTTMIVDVSKGQAKKLISAIEEYKDEIDELAFNLKKEGEKTETAYLLNPIIKMKGYDQEQFDALDGIVVTDEFFSTVLNPRTEELMVKVLHEANFPVADFGMELPEEENGADKEIPF
jgi:hypothetical protein